MYIFNDFTGNLFPFGIPENGGWRKRRPPKPIALVTTAGSYGENIRRGRKRVRFDILAEVVNLQIDAARRFASTVRGFGGKLGIDVKDGGGNRVGDGITLNSWNAVSHLC